MYTHLNETGEMNYTPFRPCLSIHADLLLYSKRKSVKQQHKLILCHYLVSEKSVDIREEREENSPEEMKTNTCKKKFEFHSTNSRNVQNKLMKVVFHDLHDVKGNILKRTVD